LLEYRNWDPTTCEMRRGHKPDWSCSGDDDSLLDRQDLSPR
jgi:hypothetical protein